VSGWYGGEWCGQRSGYLAVVERLLAGPRLLQQQVRHALPVLHHGIGLDQRVHQVRAVLVQLKDNTTIVN
jgi:hypothetical protein